MAKKRGGNAAPQSRPGRHDSDTRAASDRRVRLLGVLLTLSGYCALVYQMVWLREFRLVFGAATPATAAVLAVFMGGLGCGSALFGRRAERSSTPLALYARLEFAVALSALATPWVLRVVSSIYRATGGVVALGPGVATVLHILLSVVVLAVPCTLMGGTLPLAAKVVENDADQRRGSTGLLYGLNALGGLAGVVLSTFWMLENLGTRGTLLVATAVNACIAAVALRAASRETTPRSAPLEASAPLATADPQSAAAPARYVYAAAFVTGFVFFLCELVWYRMSAPLLGSSTYSFGIILALALGGIGIGGVLYRTLLAPRAGSGSVAAFAWVSAFQAFCLIAPYAAGDRLALLSYHANQLRSSGFGALVAGWTAIGAAMVLAPSLLAGLQFPLLVSLLGRGRERVGAQTGSALAWNTAGAISGCLLGGFLLIPGLTAPGCWRLATWLTLALAASALALALRRASIRSLWPVAAVGVAALWMSVASLGPTAAWRYEPYGYGRVRTLPSTPNGLRDWQNVARWGVRREFDGRESSVAVVAAEDYSFVVGGKSDGAAIGDAATQVMLGLISAVLHPAPQRALVVGLGTGSTAGWLADVPGMQDVDVVEIEAGILDLARSEFVPVNRDVMHKANVHTIVGDAREVLSVVGPAYDLIVSEPSNPYRAGIANLYTREFYEAVRRRLHAGGIFSQWLQGYEIDSEAVRTVYATLVSVFPYVETWVTKSNDLAFVCHLQPPAYTQESIREKLALPLFDEAVTRTWLTDSVAGFLVHHIAAPPFARQVAATAPGINTDDNNALEYGIARSASLHGSTFAISELLSAAARAGLDRPAPLTAGVDSAQMSEERILMLAANDVSFVAPPDLQGDAKERASAVAAYVSGNSPAVLAHWRGEPQGLMARLILLEANAEAGSPDATRPLVDWAGAKWPTEARLAAAFVAARDGSADAAVEHLERGFESHRTDPWVRPRMTERALRLAVEIGRQLPAEAAATLYASLAEPFVMAASDQLRLATRLELSRRLPITDQVAAADAWGQWPPWTRRYLEFRRDAYAAARDPRLAAAESDLAAFTAAEVPGSAPKIESGGPPGDGRGQSSR